MEWTAYLLLGAIAGLLAGLLGIGGGSVVVPMLVLMFGLQGFSDAVLVQVAVGTSFAIIAVTSLSSTWAHHRLANVRWPVWWVMAPGLMIGVSLGGYIATDMKGAALQVIVALFFGLLAVQMYFKLQPSRSLRIPAAGWQTLAGGIIGWLSAFVGIGGGAFAVPLFKTFGFSMKKAVGTSAACGVPIAIFGALIYALREPSVSVGYSTGFIYWPAFFGVAVASTVTARVGAAWAVRLPENVLRKSFALLLFIVSGYLFFNAQ
jgi:hypothetical protein